ncbi:HDIG domain-containing protein [Clostridium fermenticellae]|uniref:HDIG domain-containing protein n=1 Tax=Clostridium fermenticellae TaxID=2068654 RepID=A0A386H5P7_9CLOT|nr:HD family phosphohydrolase [Clostridium fermenticellae]AYD40976.1 HDIG domain-containing protein [Clostridium fermenticellae]
MINLSLKKIFGKQKINRILIFFITFLFIYSVLATSIVIKKYNLKEGDIAKLDIKAPREVKDEFSTESKIQQALNSVPLQYNKKIEVKNEVLDKISVFFSEINQLQSDQGNDNDKVKKLKSNADISLSDEDYSTLIKSNKDDLKTVQDFLSEVMADIYDNNNISDSSQKDNQEDIKKVQESILLKVNESKLPKNLKNVSLNLGYSLITPNFFYDKDKTENLKRDAAHKVQPVMIKKDQIIVKEGEPITKYQIETLQNLGLLNDNSHSELNIYIFLCIFTALIMFIEWMYIYKYYNKIYNNTNTLIMMSVLSCISILLARSVSVVSPFLIPLACIPMVFSLLVNDRVSLIINILNSMLISCVVDFNVEITLLAVLNAIVGSVVLKKMQQRNDILYSSMYIAIINSVFTFSTGFLLSNNSSDIFQKTLFAAVASILSGILTIGLLPFFENIFDVVTTIKLLELSNPNNPLLKRLLMEAPGTYHHSILVGNLAEIAAEEIGGNPVLARVSAYYHDVGKVKRPYFFKENQHGKENPHNKITPNLSALIIISHVKDGDELAKEYNVPGIIRDIIRQHHGTSLVKYFYITAKNSSERPDCVNEENFRYEGPIPQTKEAGIIMLADEVEAAVRSINEPTKCKIEEMVNNIIKNTLNEGELDECDLTLKDIAKIRKAFLRVLDGIYHHRIEYPVDKWKKAKNKKIEPYDKIKNY